MVESHYGLGRYTKLPCPQIRSLAICHLIIIQQCNSSNIGVGIDLSNIPLNDVNLTK